MEDRLLRVPEAARLLGIDGVEIYGLIERDILYAGKGPDGLVYVPESAIQRFKDEQAATAD